MYLIPNCNAFYIPRRYIFLVLGFLGMFVTFANRVSISIAMVAMTNQTAAEPENNSTFLQSECPAHDLVEMSSNETGVKGEQFNWDPQTQGVILGAYYYGYVIMQVPGGILAEKYGAKWVFGLGVFLVGFTSLITPVIAGWSVVAFSIIRGIQGLADGVTLPAITFAMSTWSPQVERSKTSTIINIGAPLGTVIGMSVSGVLCSSDFLRGWPSVFYVFGAAACIWFCFWYFLMFESPSEHPTISKEELIFIEENKQDQNKKKSIAVWIDIFSSVPMWALIIAHFGHNLGFIVLLMQLPTYLSQTQHFDMQSNGFLSALPFICQATGAFIASIAADSLRRSNKMSPTAIRKVFNCIAQFIPAVCMIGITLAGCRSDVIVALICLAMLINGSAYSGFNVTHVEMCPDLAGTLYAITNAVGNLPGILGPLCVGIFTANGATLANWNNVFYLTTGVYAVGGVIFAIFGSAELQPWGISKEEKKETEKNDPKVFIMNIQEHQSRL